MQPPSPAAGVPVWAIGLMTGTALDGQADVAMLRTDGERIEAFGPWLLHPYGAQRRARLAEAVEAARDWGFAGPEPAIFAEAATLVTDIYAEAVEALLAQGGIARSDVAVVGGHGLTVLHGPPPDGPGRTRQLLDGDRLARRLGLPVVWDFRSADMAAGGQGAPLAPIYHAALLDKGGLAPPAAILNLGGVANVTWWGGADALAAFDTGPANGPLNSWMEQHGLGAFDRDGALAASGRVHEGLLLEALDKPWFDAPYPKSLDRYDFDAGLARGLSPADGAATLTALVGACVGLALALLPRRPQELVVAGGGRRNPVMMDEIARRARVRVIDADAIGLRGDAVEAECFAHLAVRTLRGLPLSFPSTTGVAAPHPGGRVSGV